MKRISDGRLQIGLRITQCGRGKRWLQIIPSEAATGSIDRRRRGGTQQSVVLLLRLLSCLGTSFWSLYSVTSDCPSVFTVQCLFYNTATSVHNNGHSVRLLSSSAISPLLSLLFCIGKSRKSTGLLLASSHVWSHRPQMLLVQTLLLNTYYSGE